MSVIAVIPARGGSKRIPRKNIKFFAGKPMIAYAIKAAQDSRLFDHIIVSTDSDEIAEISLQHGAKIPFLRPTELADDFTPTVPVIAHAIGACEQSGWNINSVCCIYPCVPFIQKNDLINAFSQLQKTTVDYVFPVSEFTSSIQRAMYRSQSGVLSPVYPEFELTRTQDLEKTYHDAGQFYWGKKSAWLSNHRIHSSALGISIPAWRVIDIDTPEDWVRAEIIFGSTVLS
jgi:pseudaminic acid cytidylyltransferase